MGFASIGMLLGLLAVLIPIALHLLNRVSAHSVKWGAFQFLSDSVRQRKRRILFEDFILLLTRCLLLGLLAVALARPFLHPGGFLFSHSGVKAPMDVALVIDGSASMTLQAGSGETSFHLACQEARKVIQAAAADTAFAVIVGGPVPQILTPAPVTGRKELGAILDGVRPTGGTMQILPTFTAAAVTLSCGRNPGKEIILLGDGQTAGWNMEHPDRWETAAALMAQFKVHPRILWRTLPLPASVRNVAMQKIELSREVVGTDREVEVRVTLSNTGKEAVTPKAVWLMAEGVTNVNRQTGQLLPGVSQTLAFRHRFKRPGAQILQAVVEAADDLPFDDMALRVVTVADTLNVLLVNGDAKAAKFEQPSAYLEVALRPEVAEQGGVRHDFLVRPKVMDAFECSRLENLTNISVVVLADVPRLTDDAARLFGHFVENGGGLLISAGSRAQPEFYNAWQVGGTPVPPLALEAYAQYPALSPKIDPATFSKDALGALRGGADLSEAVIHQGWNAAVKTNTAAVLAQLDTGKPFLALQRVGRGTVIQSTVPLDASASGLPMRGGFVPLVHELVYYLANPMKADLNLPPSEGALLSLAGWSRSRGDSMGLTGTYYSERSFSGDVRVRVDPQIDFEWHNDCPFPGATNFPCHKYSAVWTGTLLPRRTGVYTFWVDAFSGTRVEINGEHDRKHSLEEGKAYAIRVSMQGADGETKARLYWNCEGLFQGIVPHSCLLPGAPETAGGAAGVPLDVQDPEGRLFRAALLQTDEGPALRMNRSLTPGLYHALLDEKGREQFASVSDEHGRIPFYVDPGTEESDMAAVDNQQLVFLRKYVDILRAQTEEEVLKSFVGKSFGREIWRPFAFVVLALLILEILLTRWIAIDRRIGE